MGAHRDPLVRRIWGQGARAHGDPISSDSFSGDLGHGGPFSGRPRVRGTHFQGDLFLGRLRVVGTQCQGGPFSRGPGVIGTRYHGDLFSAEPRVLALDGLLTPVGRSEPR